ncbi:MAG: two-component regulator propeller domain-containing protein, partial [Bacteroidota bacterium]
MRDGLGQSQVYDILQDSRGLIWMGTGGGGISVYDSREMRTFDGADGLSDPFIKSITELPDQRLFLGGSRFSAFYNGLMFSHVPLLEDKEVLNSHVVDNQLYVICTNAVYLFAAGEWSIIAEKMELHASATHRGELYVVSDQGLLKKKDDGWENVKERFPFSPALVNDIRFDESDVIWFSTYGYGVQQLDGDRFKRDPEMDSNVVFQTELIDDKVWYCTLNEGVLVWDGRRMISYSMANGMPSNTAISCEQDQWGNVWIGTSGGGVARLSRQAFSHMDRERGLPANQVYSIACDGDQVYMGIGEDGLYRHNKKSGSFIQDTLVNQVKVKAIHKSANTLYVGTEGNGLFVIKEDTTYRVGRGDGISGNWVRAIQEDRRGNIFIGTAGGGITQLVPGKSEKKRAQTRIFTAGTGLAEDRITDLAVDSLNRVWYSTLSEGIGVIMKDRSIINFDASQGLPSQEVKSLAIDQHQRLWIGLANAGLCSMDLRADTIRIEPFDNKLLSSKNIYFLQPDLENQLWIGTEKGVDVLRMTMEGDIQNIEHYSESDGYEGIEACTNASCMDANGALWFGTVEGVSYHQTRKEVIQTSPPNLNITNVNLFYQSLRNLPQGIFMTDWGDVRDTLVFTYEQNHVSFDFLGVHQSNPDDVQYQWYLEGQDPDWSPLNERTTATFSNLEPGSYVFHLRSCVDGNLCVESHPVYLSILRPFWQKTWFKVAGIAALIAMI